MENENLEQIKAQREIYRHKAFKMMLEIGFIIALPAFGAYFLGKYFGFNEPGNSLKLTLLLFAAFILSWSIIIYKYNRFNRKMKEIDIKIKNLNSKDQL
ncbi:MAG: hypothetical protein WCX88_01470 [Patescibacteria group bacterium]